MSIACGREARARGEVRTRASPPPLERVSTPPRQARAAKSGRAPSANLEAEKRTRAARCQPEWIKERISKSAKGFLVGS
jgi:hypothetical protein